MAHEEKVLDHMCPNNEVGGAWVCNVNKCLGCMVLVLITPCQGVGLNFGYYVTERLLGSIVGEKSAFMCCFHHARPSWLLSADVSFFHREGQDELCGPTVITWICGFVTAKSFPWSSWIALSFSFWITHNIFCIRASVTTFIHLLWLLAATCMPLLSDIEGKSQEQELVKQYQRMVPEVNCYCRYFGGKIDLVVRLFSRLRSLANEIALY